LFFKARVARGISVRFGLIPVLAFGMLSAGKLCAAVYARIEASFAITNLATDTFDYTQTDVRVQIVKPDSTTVSLPAFFDGGGDVAGAAYTDDAGAVSGNKCDAEWADDTGEFATGIGGW